MTDAARPWRNRAWIATTLVLFLPVQLAALFVASSLTSAIGIGDPQREHFAIVNTLLGGLLMVVVVPITGRLLGHRIPPRAGWLFVLPILLAAAAAYVFFADIRSGFYFETDQALPEIFIPYALVLVASAALGHRLAIGGSGWTSVVRGAAVLTVGLVGLTALKMATTGGDFALDAPVTALMLAVIGVYAVVAAAWTR